ncbi:helix-turn-helix transcriptional regulator [Acinetobacter sp. ANC 4910]|uniref:LuxR C-terminal-related transcriptional regulator n=1 Tax=Acinetobacter sp. ANC 4910 TaxID=2529850 RepID=UPI00103CD45F|nr:LuxR C-terminal-related transcriptional regulator [Acinetobacter sp. ANC 4910]TCB36159.1 helix-turn-helix transcriptional regulator [Acinetobacter sp. ANC 4910]
MQVLKTKLSRPSMMSNMVMQRPELLNQMLENCQSSLVFIHAAAGYGKTTLMYQLSEVFITKGKRVSWLTLDSDDNDPIRLYQYLWLALLGLEQLNSVPDGQIHKQNLLELVQRVSDIDSETVFFIDEFEVLENSECLNILWWLYQYLPHNCHLVIASRVKPNWSFAKEYLLGRLKLVTEVQLSIKSADSAELIHFLKQQNFDHVTLTPKLADQLIEKTEGWLTGIQLTNLYLKNYHDAGAVIQSLSGAHNQIVDYLSEQVFIQLSEEMQNFLLNISVLRKISLSNIQEVAQNPASAKLLEQMLQTGLFLQALDEQRTWYRIQHLFREFLENRFKILDAEQYKAAHLRAAYWYQQHHYLMEAIYHAQHAENQVLVLELLSAVSRELVLEGRFYSLVELVKLIPDALLVQRTTLLYDVIWSLIMTHQHLLGNHYLQLWLKIDPNERVVGDDQLGLEPMIALMGDEIKQAYELSQTNISKLSENSYFVRAPLIGIGALYHICLGKITEARKSIIQTRAAYIQGQNVFGLIITDCIEALCDYLEGNLDKALVKINHIGKSDDYLKLTSDEFLRPIVNMITSSVKGYLYYDLNEITLAENTLKHFSNGEQLIIPDLAIVGFELLLRLAHIQGDVQAEQAYLTQAQICTNNWSMPRLSRTVQNIYDQYQWFDKKQKLFETTAENLEELCHRHVEKTLNISNVITGDDLTLYRQLIFTDRETQAKVFLEQELDRILTYPLRRVRILLLLALADYRLNHNEAAFVWFEKALVILEPTKAVRIVLDEHPLLSQLLADYMRHLAQSKQKKDPSVLAFAEMLAAMCSVPLSETSVDDDLGVIQTELLSKRELQILQKVSEGCTDIELADKVFLSVNTVKWHLRNIYNKLGVRSRLEAVTEAKRKGLIL